MTGTLTASAVLAQPGRCTQCDSTLATDAVVALCSMCCPHDRQFIVMDDCRDGADGRVHYDCIACGVEVERSFDDYWDGGGVYYETLIPTHPWKGLR